MKATAIASPSIAFVKYWGKKDTKLNIPMNSSIAITLDDTLNTKTTVKFFKEYNEDIFIFNNEIQEGNRLEQVSKFLDIVREKANVNLKAKVVSINSFPTGTGIASSASGFAALAAASSKAIGLEFSNKELSALARLGSGSACRSVFGGFVKWENEYSLQLKDETYWPELRDVIIIVDNQEKKVSSREGMALTKLKSLLYQKRIQKVQSTIENVEKFLLEKDFQNLAYEIMKDSDNMHTCIEEVGIKYLNETSNEIIKQVINLNKSKIIAGYTFDAGPNAHVITLEKNLPEIINTLSSIPNTKTEIAKVGKGVRYTEEHLF